MEARPRRLLWLLGVIVLLFAIWLVGRPLRTSIVRETSWEIVPFGTQRVASADLPVGTEIVVQAGKEGRMATYVYFEETRLLGKVLSREEVPAEGLPTGETEIVAMDEIVEYGTADEYTTDVSAVSESGVDLGAIGDEGYLLMQASGTVQYWKSGTCGPEGDPTHDYTFVPLMPDANVGALLVRVGGSGAYVPYYNLEQRGGMRVVTGTPGAHVMAVINDAPGLYEDNIGGFGVRVMVP